MQQSVQLASGPTIHPTNLALMQVAVIAALCCAGYIWSVVVVVVLACCCCILYRLALMLALTCAPCTCDVFPPFNWCKHFTCTGGGWHQLQLVLVVLFHLATSAASPLVHVVVLPWHLALVVLYICIYIYICNLHCMYIYNIVTNIKPGKNLNLAPKMQ